MTYKVKLTDFIGMEPMIAEPFVIPNWLLNRIPK